MQPIVWIVRFAIVIVLVWFAVKNAQMITLHGLPDQTLQAPLVFVLLVAFVAGAVIGLLAWIPTVVRQRREIARLKRAAERHAVAAITQGAAPSPPAVPAPPREPSASDVHGI